MTAALHATHISSSVSPLTGKDRCDRCGCQAYAKVRMPSGSELLFCGHHLNLYMPVLIDVAGTIYDYSTARL
jgi:hypothetical protein